MWIRATNGECYNLDHYRRVFIQRGQQGSFDNKLHLTLMGEGQTYTDLVVLDLREIPEAEASATMDQYLADIIAAISRGDNFYELPQTGAF